MSLQILTNIAKFMERVQVSGSEAYAWVEAHQYVQGEAHKLAQSQIASTALPVAESARTAE